jgi:hypothetical protein
MASSKKTISTKSLTEPLICGNTNGMGMIPMGFIVVLQLLNLALGTGRR